MIEQSNTKYPQSLRGGGPYGPSGPAAKIQNLKLPKITDSPWVRTVRLTKPTLQDNTADTDRLISALKTDLQTDAVHIDLDLLKKLPDLLRKWEYNVRCILFKDRHH